MKTSKAFRNLIASLKAGHLDSKKQQDHLFKVLNGANDEARDAVKAYFRNPDFEGFTLSKEQNEQGYAWLMSLWKTPAGRERKENPYGYREQEALENFSHCTLVDRWSAGSYHRYEVPVYDVWTKDGYGFQYYVWGGKINIVG